MKISYVLDAREKESEKSLNKLESIIKKSLDGENILIVWALLHLLHITQALT